MIGRLNNPIILKEMLQATHSARTYAARAVLPFLGLILSTIMLIHAAKWGRTDWRDLSSILRPILTTLLWGQLIVFSIMAYGWANGVIKAEWRHRTLELLCATPLSPAGIVWGKLAAVLARLLMMFLSLLPLTACLQHLCRVPWEGVIASLAVMLGAVLLMGAIGTLEACLFHNAHGKSRGNLCVLLPLYGIIVPVHFFKYSGRSPLALLVAPHAFHQAFTMQTYMGLKPIVFGLVVLALHAGLALLFMTAAAWCFHRAFLKHIGATQNGERKRKWTRRFASKRPPLGDNENPFFWQERGERTLTLRWGAWLGYGVILAILASIPILSKETRLYSEPVLYWLAGILCFCLVNALIALQASAVFPSEKTQRTAEAVVLTAYPPWRIVLAKAAAIAWSVRFSVLVPAVILILTAYLFHGARRHGDQWDMVLFTSVLGILAGPFTLTGLALVFGLAAKTAGEGVGKILGGCGLAAGLLQLSIGLLSQFFSGDTLIFTGTSLWLVVTAVLAFVGGPWSAGRLFLLFVALFQTVCLGGVFLSEVLRWDEIHICVYATLAAMLTGAGWVALGIRHFERLFMGQGKRTAKTGGTR